MKYLSLLLLISSLALGACATNPVTGGSDFALITEEEEIEQGREYHKQIIETYGVYDDPELQKYVNRIGQKLAANSHRAHLKFHFTVLDSEEINAFALPGGYVYITRGIMAYLDSEAELAGVLGHEIGHVTARHSVRQQAGQFAGDLLSVLIAATTGQSSLGNLSQQLSTGLIRGYGREHELEADRLGAEYLHKTNYDPDNMLEVIGVLKDQEVYETQLAKRENRQPNTYHGVYSTHPRNDDRLQTVVRAAKDLSVTEYRGDNQKGYQNRIDGMVWGSSLRQGVVVKNRFAHPELALSLQLPNGWKVNNNPQYLMASNPENGALVQIGVVARNKGESATEALRRLGKNSELEVQATDYGATTTTQVSASDGESQPARVSTIVLGDDNLLMLLGTSDKKHFKETDARLLEINRSFQRLDAAQVAAIRAPRLRIIPRTNQSFGTLARDSALEYDAANILRLLNRSFPSGKISNLTTLKTVTLDD
jgi:predicted Zn-dependent protease